MVNEDKTVHKDGKLTVFNSGHIRPTNKLRLCVWPFGRWEVDAVEGDIIFLIDGPGMVIANFNQCILLDH